MPNTRKVLDKAIKAMDADWTSKYSEFTKLVDKHFPDVKKIQSEAKKLYMQHKGEALWDEAWRRWMEKK